MEKRGMKSLRPSGSYDDSKRPAESVIRRVSLWCLLGSTAIGSIFGCASVRPEQRAILADPIMQFESEPSEAAGRQHVLENRAAAVGAGAIKAGGCGCN